MVETPEKISEVFAFGNEYYFRFGSHVFSVLSRTEQTEKYGEHSFYVYPGWKSTLQNLANTYQSGNDAPMVVYHEYELPNSTKFQLRQLSKLLEEKSLNIPKIFDDVINEPPG